MSDAPPSPPSPAPLPNPLATASLVMALMSVPLFLLMWVEPIPIFWLTSIMAIIFGHVARRKIGRTFGPVAGARAARLGMWLGYTVALFVPLLIAAFAPPVSRIAARGNMTKAINNCRQIITVLRLYSGDHNGNYPDTALPNAKTSNEIFRELFASGALDNEMIFGNPMNGINPDGNIGKAPDYAEALKPGENGWAMTRNLTDSSGGYVPLVYEAPSVASWPPRWDAERPGKPPPGYTRPEPGRIVIGMNDSSVIVGKLERKTGKDLLLETGPSSAAPFPPADRDSKDRPYSVLNVAQ